MIVFFNVHLSLEFQWNNKMEKNYLTFGSGSKNDVFRGTLKVLLLEPESEKQ